MSFFDSQNPGIGGLDELTDSETALLESLDSLGDPNADRILFWDDSAGSFQYLTIGTGLSITGTTLDASGGSGATTALDNLASVAINTSLIPGTSDGAALGSTTKMWSDLFVASGAVINFNNGNVTLTHGAGSLTLGGSGATTLALGSNSLTLTGSIAATGARVTKGWFTDIESSNMPTVGGTSLSSTFAAIAQTFFIGTTQVAINRSSAALTLAGITLTTPNIGTPSAGTLTNCTGLPIAGLVASTSTALGVGSIELGHASDTTISRVSAGVIAVEGKTVLTTDGGTLTGSITLGENTSIALDPAGSADGKWSGITITATAGYAQAFGDLVYLDPTDSRWEKCDANSAAGADGDSRGIIGIVVVAGAADGNACTILLQGVIRADAAFPTFTINNPIYVSETAGAVTQTQPTTTDVVIRVVGFALTADEMYFNPSPTYITHT